MTSDLLSASMTEKERWKKDFPRSTKKIFFVRGDENLLLRDMFILHATQWGPYIPFDFLLNRFPTTPASSSHLSLKRTDGVPFSVVVGPDKNGDNAKDNAFARAAQSKVPLDIWDRWVWDHETAHAMQASQARPLYVSIPHFAETVSDTYGLLRAHQRAGREAAEALTKDLLTMRRFMGVSDCLHYTEPGILAAQKWARHMGPRLNRYTATGLLSVAETLAGQTAFSVARSNFLRKTFRRYEITRGMSLYDRAMMLAERMCLPTSNPFIQNMRQQFVQAALTAGKRLGLDGEGLIPCVALATRPPFNVTSLLLNVALMVGCLRPPDKRLVEAVRFYETPRLGFGQDGVAYGADPLDVLIKQRAQEQLQQVSKELDQDFYPGAAAKVKEAFQKTPDKLLSRGGRREFVEDEILLWQQRQAVEGSERSKEWQKDLQRGYKLDAFSPHI